MRHENGNGERKITGGESAPVFQLDREKTALIVVDMQNDFVREGGALEVPDARKRIPQVKKLIQGCQDLSIPIVFVKFVAGPKRTLVWNWSSMISPPVKCCWRNHRRYYPDIGEEREVSEIIDEITVKSEDYVIDKYSYGSFYNTSLEDILRAHDTEHVIICGAAMPVCINDTVSGAFDRQFKVAVAADATASFTEEFRRYSLSLFKAKYARVLDTTEILSELRNKDEQPV
ncbi:cysteine hydrolase [Candidatus Bipolaricaulota bacterium]|nr:cysteine hydrolase [Candidatus Bipolaricaulota bacterium]